MELLDTPISISEENAVLCPKCKAANVPNIPNVRFFQKLVKCPDANCSLLIFHNISEKQLSFIKSSPARLKKVLIDCF